MQLASAPNAVFGQQSGPTSRQNGVDGLTKLKGQNESKNIFYEKGKAAKDFALNIESESPVNKSGIAEISHDYY